jgi:outer membrane lipoprotein-sorting protein
MLLLTVMAPVQAQTAAEKGLAIAQELERRDDGFGDVRADMKMILTNSQGEESVRDIRLRMLEVPGDGDKSMSIFDSPADVKGTAMLTWSHKVEVDDQWLYLPALKRVKRIASRNRSGSFMGSEFAFEDLGSQEMEKYTYKYLGDEMLNGLACVLLERYPVDQYSGYKRQHVWIDKAEYRLQKIEFYDRKDSLLKTLIYSGYHQFLNKYWRAEEMFMENHQTGKSTKLLWSDYRFGNGFKDDDFTHNSLKRTR